MSRDDGWAGAVLRFALLRSFSLRETGPTTRRRIGRWFTSCAGDYSWDWPDLLGTVFVHRKACMLAALRALDRAIGKPKVTRVGLRREMLAALAADR